MTLIERLEKRASLHGTGPDADLHLDSADRIKSLRKMLAELLDIIDQGDTSEAWQIALLAARAELAIL
jgi:hypothetical protein